MNEKALSDKRREERSAQSAGHYGITESWQVNARYRDRIRRYSKK